MGCTGAGAGGFPCRCEHQTGREGVLPVLCVGALLCVCVCAVCRCVAIEVRRSY